MKSFILSDGSSIPVVSFGPDEMGYSPYRFKEKNTLYKRIKRRITNKFINRPKYIGAITNAIKEGFYSIDYSAAYGDGRMIGEAIKASGISRDNLFITTRVSNRAQYNKNIEEEFFNQLKGFGTNYVDMLMFHWPVDEHYEQTWLKMIELKEQGYCKVLGVANCHAHHLKRLKEISGIFPLVNQVEVHPLFTQVPLREFCKKNNIQVESYSPTARQDDRLMRLSLWKPLIQKYNKNITQLILKWHIQNGMIPVIRTFNKEHQKQNLNIFDFEILKEDMLLIDNININSRLRYDPDNCDFSIL